MYIHIYVTNSVTTKKKVTNCVCNFNGLLLTFAVVIVCVFCLCAINIKQLYNLLMNMVF